MAYPGWFRKKVLAYQKKHGLSIREAASYFKIGSASIMRWHTQPEPAQSRKKSPLKIPDEALARDVKNYPDDFHYERASRFNVSAVAIHLALKRLGLTRKKNASSSKKR